MFLQEGRRAWEEEGNFKTLPLMTLIRLICADQNKEQRKE
jgi:hypothetical protein